MIRLILAVTCLAVAASARSSRDFLNTNKSPSNPHGTSQYPYTYLSVCTNGTSTDLLEIQYSKKCENGSQIALGRYTNQVNTTGWGILEIETFSGFPYDVQAYAAGVAEGELTRLQIYYHYRNTIEELCTNHTLYCKRLYKYLSKNLDWLRSQVVANDPNDPYWRHVNLTFAQITGMYDGYMKRNLTPEIGFDLHPIYMIQLSGELFDLNKYLNKTPDPQEYPEAGRCSGFVKFADGNKDLFFSHVAMSSYSTMNRVLKLYKFAYDKAEVPGHTVSFSGYPAALASADDYTLTSAGLASIETTIAIFNNTLYTDAFIKPEGQVHCWIRSFLSNALTKTSKDWVNLFAKYNSGTYNNQWTVVDYKLFKPGQATPQKDFIWILEQTPGYTSTRDMTWFMKRFTYFPSYNIPYLTDVSIVSGFNLKAAQYDWYKWGASPRARIFQRDHNKVQDIDSLTKLMRYNDYTHDEFAKCKCNPPYTAEAGISARGDLNPVNGTYEVESMGFRNHGGLDYKGTNYEMFKKLRFRAWGGPPYDPLPPFSWASTNVVSPHFGQPTVWNFTYIDLEWETEVAVLGFDY
ncbi:unnamed protein product [Auanema sp. JU1783]|nr:unnamed protein product [Auanema sp. JU1783]